MDTELIHKPDNDNVMSNALNCKEEYQREMPCESTQILQTMFVGESDLKRKTQEVYTKDCLAQSYFNDLSYKKKVKGITFLDGLLRWK